MLMFMESAIRKKRKIISIAGSSWNGIGTYFVQSETGPNNVAGGPW